MFCQSGSYRLPQQGRGLPRTRTLSKLTSTVVNSRTTTDRNEDTRSRRQPRYHVILWDDNDHSYEYVIRMMKELFGHDYARGYKLAETVDSAGRAVCLTTTKEHAELKRDQIHAYGRDHLMRRSQGSMSATIEPESD